MRWQYRCHGREYDSGKVYPVRATLSGKNLRDPQQKNEMLKPLYTTNGIPSTDYRNCYHMFVRIGRWRPVLCDKLKLETVKAPR